MTHLRALNSRTARSPDRHSWFKQLYHVGGLQYPSGTTTSCSLATTSDLSPASTGTAPLAALVELSAKFMGMWITQFIVLIFHTELGVTHNMIAKHGILVIALHCLPLTCPNSHMAYTRG